MSAIARQIALLESLALRATIPESLTAWATRYLADFDQKPAAHHLLMLDALQAVTDGKLIHPTTGKPCNNLIILMPPSSAKSRYSSVIFPAWFIQRRPNCRLLGVSCGADLIEAFSRECRNAIEQHSKVLGYSLAPDSRAVQEWSTTNGGSYFCLGIGGKISGRRSDCTVIDDYIGSEEDADSQLVRDKQWAWLEGDCLPRSKPNGIRIIVANCRHEDDIVGRLLSRYPKDWYVIRLPFFATEGDVLGRAPADRAACLGHLDMSRVQVSELESDPKVWPLLDSRLWPEFFTRQQAAEVLLKPPRVQSGLYQQQPTPEDGEYFKKEWLRTYDQTEYDTLMRSNPRIYAAGDWAVSEDKDANRSCFGCGALDSDGILYILPDLFWKVAGPEEVVPAFIDLLARRKPIQTWSESGHISKAWGPFLKQEMERRGTFFPITEVVPSKSKDVRARSIQGMMSMHKVRFPSFAHWWPAAQRELLSFMGGGNTDDFVDFLAHLGAGVNKMARTGPVKIEPEFTINAPFVPTLNWLKSTTRSRPKAIYSDN